MTKPGKRVKAIYEECPPEQEYSLSDALSLLKKTSRVKFDESVEVSYRLGIDTRKSDQMVRGVADLPHGLGKTVRIAVFTQPDQFDAAKEAGADVVGLDDLAEKAKQGDFAYDVVLATPDAMTTVGKLGTILGPKGLMPNPKLGTVTTQLAAAIRSAKAGQAKFRADKGGVVNTAIGKLSFDVSQLEENFKALTDAIVHARPANAKGHFVKKITLSSTMGPGLTIDRNAAGVLS